MGSAHHLPAAHAGRFEYPTSEADVWKASSRTVRFVVVPPRTCLAIDGCGDPKASQEFQAAIATLFPVAYQLRTGLLRRGVRSHVHTLEGRWQTFPQAGDMGFPRWTLLVQVPDEASRAEIRTAISDAQDRRSLPAVGRMRIEALPEVHCAQVLHVGPYDAEGPTIARLDAAIAAAGLHAVGPHQEVYLGDPRRAAPDRLRTLLRRQVF